MEARLFFISIWCGIYGQALRGVFRIDEWSKKIWVAVLFNSFFWGTVGFILGMLKASYMAGAEFNLTYSGIFAILGIGFGGALGFWRGRDEEKRDILLKDNLEWADTGFSAILLASVVMFFVVQAFKIPSGSMRMTFVEGDHLFVNKFIYGVPVPLTKKKILPLKSVTNKDVVIFRFPSDDKANAHFGKDFIKRVVALEGQRVQVKNKQLFVDGLRVDEPYKQHADDNIFVPNFLVPDDMFQKQWVSGELANYMGNDVRDNFGPVTVPKGHVMVMGDNRDRSFDSRFWGPLPLTEIKGKALLVYWPFRRFRLVHK